MRKMNSGIRQLFEFEVDQAKKVYGNDKDKLKIYMRGFVAGLGSFSGIATSAINKADDEVCEALNSIDETMDDNLV